MRFARKLMLLAVAAAATIALTASSAQALEIATESTGVHCTAVTPVGAEPFITHGAGGGGCLIRVHSVGTVEFSAFGSMTECNNAFEGRTNELGEGYFYSQSLTNCTPTAEAPCNADGVAPNENWIFHFNAESGANGAEIRTCRVSGGITFNCHLLLDVSEPTLHRYRFSTGGVHRFCENNGFISFRGTWEQEVDTVHPAIEIRG
jgi:hypothetical protein